ncbi:hypothetical protein HDF24_11665 [Mucilaginibacter sp. X4EP1]|nr:hypothetical protein [Mucilaginibacter sp. X4EP1]
MLIIKIPFPYPLTYKCKGRLLLLGADPPIGGRHDENGDIFSGLLY